ncbi:MAG: DUF1697 domain-containing protein [Flavipsychrobacter sp.]
MAKYIAFFRAINVSGSRIIKMELLRETISSMGFKNIATYIQSGNLYFETRTSKNETLAKKIEKHLLEQLNFEVEVIVRSMEELKKTDQQDPYQHIEVDKTVAVYTNFLSAMPEKEQIELLYSYNNDIEECKIIGQELYYLCYKNKGKTKMTNKLIESKLKVFATSRNRNTVRKLISLYD